MYELNVFHAMFQASFKRKKILYLTSRGKYGCGFQSGNTSNRLRTFETYNVLEAVTKVLSQLQEFTDVCLLNTTLGSHTSSLFSISSMILFLLREKIIPN